MGMVNIKFRIFTFWWRAVERKRNEVQEMHTGFSPLLVRFYFMIWVVGTWVLILLFIMFLEIKLFHNKCKKQGFFFFKQEMHIWNLAFSLKSCVTINKWQPLSPQLCKVQKPTQINSNDFVRFWRSSLKTNWKKISLWGFQDLSLLCVFLF